MTNSAIDEAIDFCERIVFKGLEDTLDKIGANLVKALPIETHDAEYTKIVSILNYSTFEGRFETLQKAKANNQLFTMSGMGNKKYIEVLADLVLRETIKIHEDLLPKDNNHPTRVIQLRSAIKEPEPAKPTGVPIDIEGLSQGETKENKEGGDTK